MEPCIVVRDVEQGYGSGQRRAQILRGISLEVARGEVVFLVGPSGSGKTTLLSLLGCLLTPDRGEIRILGRDVSKGNPAEREDFRRNHLGFVFQTFNLFPTLSALDNVRLALCMRGVALKSARARAAELLAQVGLEHRSWMRPTRLSTGECQRVAIARALANEPEILLADEPTAALDAENGQAVLRLLSRMTEERGVTVVIVTHDSRIYPYADRILRLENGYLTLAHDVAIASAEPNLLEFSPPRPGPAHPPAAGHGESVSTLILPLTTGFVEDHPSPMIASHPREIHTFTPPAVPHEHDLTQIRDATISGTGSAAPAFSTRIDCGGFSCHPPGLPADVLSGTASHVQYVMEDTSARANSESRPDEPHRRD